MELSEIIQLISGVTGAIKRNEDGSIALDRGKLALLAGSFVGAQLSNRWREGREQKVVRKAKKLGLSEQDVEKLQNKRGKLGRNLTIGAVLGAIGYLLIMKPEQRTELFKNIDNAINEAGSLINEIQGKPYSENYVEGETK